MRAPDSTQILPHHGEAWLFPHFLSGQEADQTYACLAKEIQWEQKPIRMFGKLVPQPRLTAWYGDEGISYRYSGLTQTSLPWHPALESLRRKVEIACDTEFNSVLLNWYRDGRDSMGWHRDNEKELGNEPTIASLSLGEAREFQFRNQNNTREKISVALPHGSLLFMRGAVQENWAHCLPKRAGNLHGRINLTFRFVHS
jgi:alkylated DNA repair dioxygenase AlkB